MWTFAKVSDWQVSSAPKHDEFFASDNRSIAHSLVREVSQNSGDASANGSRVDVRFRFLEVDSALLRDRYLRGLAEHLGAVAVHFPAVGLALRQLDAERVRILLVEDFGTTGLTGAYDNPRAKGNFNGFWRRFGQSEKGEAKGGRHGVGKSTVASASAIKTVFGATVRIDDGKRLLYGQATLRPHEIPGEDVLYDSYGVFAANAPPEAPRPYFDRDVDEFAENFGLRRRQEPGLSLVIPLPVEELTAESLVVAAIEHCFHQVLDGQLTFDVDGVVIDRDTLADLAAARDATAHLIGAIALSQEALAGVSLVVSSADSRRDRLDSGEFSDESVATLRGRWLAGETVAVRLTVPAIRHRDPQLRTEQPGEAMLYVRKVEDPKQAVETYVRGRLMVPERRLTGRDCLSLMVAEDGPLSTMLGDSEQPSHTKWVQAKLKESYLAPEFPFRRARYGLVDLEKLLVGAKDGEALPDLLKAFFSAPAEGPAGKDRGTPPLIPPAATPPVLEIRRIEGGFVAELDSAATASVPRALLQVRYDVRRGRPKFRKQDFDLGAVPFVVNVESGQAQVVKRSEQGALELRDVTPGFRMRVTGFDPNRDLYVRADPEGEEDEETAE